MANYEMFSFMSNYEIFLPIILIGICLGISFVKDFIIEKFKPKVRDKPTYQKFEYKKMYFNPILTFRREPYLVRN